MRIWERARKLVVQARSANNARSHDWAIAGKSVEGAAWHQSLLDEAATADGLVFGATFMDMAKAFERISLHHVWTAGLKHRFPVLILRLMLEAFAFARRISYTCAFSEPIDTISAVLAGGGLAQVALFLVLIDPMDRIQKVCDIGVTLCLYVGDIAVHVAGSPDVVAHTLTACIDELGVALEDDLGIKVSRREPWANTGKAKTVVAVSHQRLASRITTAMRRPGVVVTRK